MTIPTVLKIGAHIYQIIETNHQTGEEWGSVDREKNIILIYAKLPPTQKIATLMHEVLHALNNELDHTVLDGLAEGLTQVLVDNKLIKNDGTN